MDDPRKKFQTLLRELFQLDAAGELDFGIYRIIAQKRDVVEKFIEQELLDVIASELKNGALKQESDATSQLAELAEQICENLADDAIDADGNLDEGHHDTKLGKQYLALQKKAAGAQTAETREATIYNHLYHFFSRYYDKGDFMSLRRYSKREKYAIPYNGEEVYLHWANADQYYIKTGENFTDYRWKAPSGNVRVRFTVTRANVPKDNIKAPDKRYFIPQIKEVKVEKIGKSRDKDRYTLVTVPFHYRGLTDKETKNWEKEAKERGIKNSNGNGGKLQAAMLADATEKIPNLADLKKNNDAQSAMISEKRRTIDGTPVTRLEHHLKRFAVKNTSDYFIHKDLGGFLTRELDFYIKNEVLNLDSLETGGETRADGWFQLMQVIRGIGGKIIEFIGQLEDFQKRLFEKKKFVTETHYCVTLDLVPEELIGEIVKNKSQIAEWIELLDAKSIKGWKDRPTAAFLRANPYLVLDTKHFDETFVDHLLESQANAHGLVIRSENYQALSLVGERYRNSLKCVYLDPPYNTDVSSIPYKNDYKHSAWGTLMHDRLRLIREMVSNAGAVFVSIDKAERTILEHVMDRVFDGGNKVEELIWSQNTNDGRSPTYSTNHEYVLVYAKHLETVENEFHMFREAKPGCIEVIELVAELNPDYPAPAEIKLKVRELYAKHLAEYRASIEADPVLKWETEKRNNPWKGIYQYKFAEYRDKAGKFVEYSQAKKRRAKIWIYRESDWTIMSSEAKQSASTRDSKNPNYRYYKVKHPVTKKFCNESTRGWKGTQFIDPEHPDRNSFESLVTDHRIAFGEDENKVPQQKRFLHEVETNVCKSIFTDYSDGEKQTTELFGRSGVFLAPKHTNFVSRFIEQSTKTVGVILDCFGGSGSTADAVIRLNHDGNQYEYVTVEVGEYFNTILLPRLKKRMHCNEWAAGKPSRNVDGTSQCVQYLCLESYEDAVSNIAFSENENAQKQFAFDEYCINYMLEFETSESETLLNIEKLASPFDYTLEIRDGEESTFKNVDLPETFNFLIGLRVQTRKVYWSGKGKNKVKYLVYRGRTNPHATGGEREVVVVWRTTKGWGKNELEADMKFVADNDLIKDADEVFMNSETFVKNARLLDPVFKRRMFNQE